MAFLLSETVSGYVGPAVGAVRGSGGGGEARRVVAGVLPGLVVVATDRVLALREADQDEALPGEAVRGEAVEVEPGLDLAVEGLGVVVLAKRDAAAAWVKTVNTSGDVQDTWGYLLASEAVIKDAANWTSLKAAAQTFR